PAWHGRGVRPGPIRSSQPRSRARRVGASTDRGSAHNAPRICGDFLRVLGALTSPPNDGTRLTCVLELTAGDRCAPLVRPCAGRFGKMFLQLSAIHRSKDSRSCRAWEPGPVERSETTND